MTEKSAKIRTGFTLLEILVAMFILSVVATIVFGAYAGTFRVIEGAEAQADHYQMARIALTRIQDDLECGLTSKTHSDIPFIGRNETIDDREADYISFLSSKHLSLDDQDAYSGYAAVSFYLEEDPEAEEDQESLILYRSDRPVHAEPAEEKTGGLVLCKDLHSFNLLYYDEDGKEYEDWDSSNTSFSAVPSKAPSMIMIRLYFVNKDDPESPMKFETGIAIPMAKTEYGT